MNVLLGGYIPNRKRRMLHEEWKCIDELVKIDSDIRMLFSFYADRLERIRTKYPQALEKVCQ
jgi:hypothetical protein